MIYGAFVKVLGGRAVCVQEGKVQGELRQPTVQLLGPPGSSTVTVHTEGATKYTLDVTKVMFASGNGTERMRFGKLDMVQGEVVVDMFAGIGYFTVPLAKHGKAERVFAIEKNPDSFHFLEENLRLNQVSHCVTPLLGDNRTAGDEAVGKADRVLMGYLPPPTEFLPRALQFARPQGCIIHYHYLCKMEEKESVPGADFQKACEGKWRFTVTYVSTVKSYAPKVYHFVADVRVEHL
eukprot:TRINITY_DN5453_c0_g1_i2.p1 TRINITY_DN5453_c0_g1~~TRINITY_DN5453_c0_g1_i2.p1  ORF type:complete len:236 (-),score=38.17 TRINITY_DN5453_c0_g1_i2:36-743(-)